MRTDFSLLQHPRLEHLPVPDADRKNKADLTRCAEDILLAREHHFPATIADLYDPDAMPADLRAAHERNDEVLERIYIGRRFKNDTERLEKLFDLYTKMTAAAAATKAQEAQSGSQRMTDKIKSVPSVSVTYARNGARPRPMRSACGRCRNAPTRSAASSICSSSRRRRRARAAR